MNDDLSDEVSAQKNKSVYHDFVSRERTQQPLHSMSIVLLESQYLPPISYFTSIMTHDEVLLERCEHYTKQSYRNRCHIKSSQGKEMLIVPVTAKHGKAMITDVRIDYQQKWLSQHLRALQTAYGKAPFYEYYVHDLQAILSKKPTFLYDLNYDLLSLCLNWLKLNKPIKETTMYEKEPIIPVIDRRNTINPKKNVFIDKAEPNLPEYSQVFGSKFVADLSIVDLIFCRGPEASAFVLPRHRLNEQLKTGKR